MPEAHSLPDPASRPAADASADARGTHRGPAEWRLNLGCGGKRLDGFVGVDRFPTPAVDVLADLGATLPFADGTVAEVMLDNVIEHMPDIPALMREMHRICRHDARIVIRTPHFTSLSSWRDPTHLHHLSYFSMDHFERPGVAHLQTERNAKLDALGVQRIVAAIIGRQVPPPRQDAQRAQRELAHRAAQLAHGLHRPPQIHRRDADVQLRRLTHERRDLII